MTKVKTNEVSGVALDYLVESILDKVYVSSLTPAEYLLAHKVNQCCYSSDIRLAFPLMDEAGIGYQRHKSPLYGTHISAAAWTDDPRFYGQHGRALASGLNIIEACMRCYATLHLGSVVDIPNEILVASILPKGQTMLKTASLKGHVLERIVHQIEGGRYDAELDITRVFEDAMFKRLEKLGFYVEEMPSGDDAPDDFRAKRVLLSMEDGQSDCIVYGHTAREAVLRSFVWAHYGAEVPLPDDLRVDDTMEMSSTPSL